MKYLHFRFDSLFYIIKAWVLFCIDTFLSLSPLEMSNDVIDLWCLRALASAIKPSIPMKLPKFSVMNHYLSREWQHTPKPNLFECCISFYCFVSLQYQTKFCCPFFLDWVVCEPVKELLKNQIDSEWNRVYAKLLRSMLVREVFMDKAPQRLLTPSSPRQFTVK